MWEEVQLNKGVKLNPCRRKWDVVVNYGSNFPKLEGNSLAIHALVLVFRPYKLPSIKLIASFATNGSASNQALQTIVKKAITSLFSKGTIV